MKSFAPFAFMLAFACAPASPTRGEPSAAGVGRARFEVRTRHTDLLPVKVWFPADAEGLPTATTPPAFVFVQGGLVDVDSYAWLAERLAAAGHVVAMPEHTLKLAIFEIDDGRSAAAVLRAPPAGSLISSQELIAVGGHSLGGVVAAKLALKGGFDGLVLLASYPDTADAIDTLAVPSLSVAGTLDCSAPRAKVEAGASSLPFPSALVMLEGVTHYQFTGSQQPDVDKGCLPKVELDVAHARIERAVGAFLEALRTGAPLSVALPSSAGVEVTVR